MAMAMPGPADLSRASEIGELALAEAGGEHEARARALHAGAIVDMNAGAIGRASARLEESLRLFELCNNPRGDRRCGRRSCHGSGHGGATPRGRRIPGPGSSALR